MTNDNNVLTKFSDIITSYQDSPNTGEKFTPVSTKNINANASRCLQCQRQISLSQYSPYCSSHCMNEHDKGVKIDHKGSEKNAFLKFSDIFTQ